MKLFLKSVPKMKSELGSTLVCDEGKSTEQIRGWEPVIVVTQLNLSKFVQKIQQLCES